MRDGDDWTVEERREQDGRGGAWKKRKKGMYESSPPSTVPGHVLSSIYTTEV